MIMVLHFMRFTRSFPVLGVNPFDPKHRPAPPPEPPVLGPPAPDWRDRALALTPNSALPPDMQQPVCPVFGTDAEPNPPHPFDNHQQFDVSLIDPADVDWSAQEEEDT